MPAFRPLPPRPSLEFERKEAKELLRRLRVAEADALERARARHSAMDTSAPERIRLADAQLVIAREYGFASWPRLVRYFGDAERQQYSYHGSLGGRDRYDGSVRSLLAQHRGRAVSAWRTLGSYVPRFYGKPAEEIFAATVTEDEVRLAVARSEGFPSWQVLLEYTQAEIPREPDAWHLDPRQYAGRAIGAADLEGLKRVVDTYPELLHPSDYIDSMGGSLLSSALHHERRQGVAAMRPIIDWLTAQGLDLQLELNRQLCGRMDMKADTVRWLLDRGADPNWIAPNGLSVLEHALIRYWNGEAVDVLADRVVPRDAFWIAAGLGDVDGVRRFLDAHGKPTAEARRHRPDFVAAGFQIPSHPDPDDDEILMEAFVVAMQNGRIAVLDYMLSRGFPVDSLVWDMPVVCVAAGNGMLPVVECLVRWGADLDLRGRHPRQSARELARYVFEHNSQNAEARRVVELCGMDPDAILAERDAAPMHPPRLEPKLLEALELASDDAFRLGQPDIRPENLLFGLLRSSAPVRGPSGLPFHILTRWSRMDLDSFRAELKDRVRPIDDRIEHAKLPMHSDARAMIDAAIEIATERRRETVTGCHLLYSLTKAGEGPVADLLARYGSSAAIVHERLEGNV
jgi:hypothetical protein